MPVCSKIRKPERRVCAGDLRDLVTLRDRAIQPPVFGQAEYSEDLNAGVDVWSMIQTVNGRTIFKGVEAGDVAITHEVTIRWRADVTSESWLELGDGRLLDVVDTENLDERRSFLVLRCRERGDEALGASRA